MGYHIDGEPNYTNKACFHMDVPKLNGSDPLLLLSVIFLPDVSMAPYCLINLDFTALVGIYLKDIVAENHGNFTVFPGAYFLSNLLLFSLAGSHYAHAEYFIEHGPDSIVNNKGIFSYSFTISAY
jgi:hypothetical protein